MNKPASKTRPAPTIERFAYRCDTCKVKFNWDINSRWYGTWQQFDSGEPLPTFCCQGCANTHAKKTGTGKSLIQPQ